jgi:catalase
VAGEGLVSTTVAQDNLSDEFFDGFEAALAKHRAWERKTDSVPA